MRLAVLRLRPVNDTFLAVPLVLVELRDLVDALAREHQDSDGAGVGRVDWRVRRFEPPVQADVPLFLQPPRAGDLRFGRDAGGGVVD